MKLLIIVLVVACLSQKSPFMTSMSNTEVCEQLDYLRPDIFYLTGTATSSAIPTCASISFGIEVKDVSASIALAKAATISDAAVSALKQSSVDSLKISTADFTLQPHTEQQYLQDTGNYKITFKGYRISNSIVVETKNLNDVGKLIDQAVKAGVNSVQNVKFDISSDEKSKINDILIEQAIEDARHKANIILAGLNMKIDAIKSVSLDGEPYRDYRGGQDTTQSQQVTVGFIISSVV